MSDTNIPEWAEKEARLRIARVFNETYSHRKVNESGAVFSKHVVNPLAEMIAKHEKPPADKVEVALNNAINHLYLYNATVDHRKASYRSRWEEAVAILKEALNEQA